MVNAYHAIFGSYGFWLPNDPRSSWSDFVGAFELFLRGGRATKTESRRSAAADRHDVRIRLETKKGLKLPEVRWTGLQARTIGQAFGVEAARIKCPIYALSILPQHVHVVFGRTHLTAETVVRLLKAEASKSLLADGLHPFAAMPRFDGRISTTWAKRCWKVYLSAIETIADAIEYVEENPIKEGKRAQRWSFVVPYPGLAAAH
jgi:REP element-mobilizing transposase RayT